VRWDLLTATSLIRLAVRESNPLPTDSVQVRRVRSQYLTFLWRGFGKRKSFVPDEFFYNVLIDAFGQNSDDAQARAVVNEMEDSGFTPDIYTMNTLMAASARRRDFDACTGIYEEILARGLRPDEFTICSLISACGSDGARVRDVAQILKLASDLGLKRNHAILNAAIASYGKNLDGALKLWDFFRRGGDRPGIAGYEGLLRVCGAAGRPDEALRVVYAMKKDGHRVKVDAYSAFVRGVEEFNAREVYSGLKKPYLSLLQAECGAATSRENFPVQRIRLKF